jgi:hypothetical protein
MLPLVSSSRPERYRTVLRDNRTDLLFDSILKEAKALLRKIGNRAIPLIGHQYGHKDDLYIGPHKSGGGSVWPGVAQFPRRNRDARFGVLS